MCCVYCLFSFCPLHLPCLPLCLQWIEMLESPNPVKLCSKSGQSKLCRSNSPEETFFRKELGPGELRGTQQHQDLSWPIWKYFTERSRPCPRFTCGAIQHAAMEHRLRQGESICVRLILNVIPGSGHLQSVWSCVPESYLCRLTQTWFEAWLNLKAPHQPDLALAKLYVMGGGLSSSVHFLSQCPKHEPRLQLWLGWSITLWQMTYQHKFHILHCN